MTKRAKRWPIWKIALGTAGCGVGAVLLFWLSLLAERLAPAGSANSNSPAAVFTLPAFVAMMAIAASLLCVLGLIWLILRIRDARIPAWKKRERKKRR
jgi:hypothetical protein